MNFSGLGVAMVTPMDSKKNIDKVGLVRLTEHLISNGVDYLVVQGTTGESVTLSMIEKQEVLDIVVKTNNNRIPVVFGIGGNNTKQVVADFSNYDLSHVDAILSVSPAYNKPSQEGIYQHFEAISNATDLPILLYNVPGRTASNMTAETTLRLANNFDNIIAIKEASGDFSQIMDIINKSPDGFNVISGDGPITLPLMSVGAIGVISVVGNAFPEELSCMISSYIKGDTETAKNQHYLLLDTISSIFMDGNPAGIKEILNLLGICDRYVRLPLVNVNSEVAEIIENEAKKVINTQITC